MSTLDTYVVSTLQVHQVRQSINELASLTGQHADDCAKFTTQRD